MKKSPHSGPRPTRPLSPPRNPPRSSVEGVLANIGQVSHDSRADRLRSWSKLAEGQATRLTSSRVSARQIGRLPTRISEHYRPHQMRYEGPVVLSKAARWAPMCIYCGGPCESIRLIRSSDNIERAEEHWRCVGTSPCVGSRKLVVKACYPLAQYDRRS